MATTVARLEAILSADTDQFDRAMGKSDTKMKGVAKTMGKAGLAGAAIGLGVAVKAGFDEFMQAERVTAQTNAVLKSTAGIANTTTKSVKDLSESLMKKSGVDDEVIQSGANVLLTFTKIRNESGKGNDIFDQSTKAALNLSVALGKDLNSSAIMVGKALNDPIKGISAMGRAGVQFTDEQKEMVKQMVVAGDQMGAQKVILKELETQFGGSAEAAGKTFSGQINIAKESMKNFAGEMVAKSIPTLTAAAKSFREDVVPAIKAVWSFIDTNLVPIFKSLSTVVTDAWKAIAKVLKDNEKDIDKILSGAETLFKAIGTTLLWLWEKVWVPILSVWFTKVLPEALGIAIKAIGLLVTAIEGIKDGFIWLRDKGGPAIETMWKVVKAPFDAMADSVRDIRDLFKSLVGWVQDAITWLGKLKMPKFDLPDLNPFGDPKDPNMSLPGLPVGNLMGANAEMGPFAALARTFGLQVTSGLRPGAITANGTPSDHGYGKALDLAGSAASMAAFFMSLVGNRMVKQAFYDPLGSIFGGIRSSYREGGHSDHVHVATYDQGGILRPGLTMAYNGTGRNEYVSKGDGPGTIIVQVGTDTLARLVRNAKGKWEQQNGRAF